MLKILIKFGKRLNYYGRVNKKYPTINADQDNILTFLSDLKEKNFIDSYKFIYDIKK